MFTTINLETRCHFGRATWLLRIDLAAGQGETAKACLQDRVPFCGLVLSEAHARKLEIMLTDYVLEQFKTESSTHYRPDCVEPAAQDEEQPQKKQKKGQEKEKKDKEGDKEKKKDKKTPKEEEEPPADGEPKKKSRRKPRRRRKRTKRGKVLAVRVPRCLGELWRPAGRAVSAYGPKNLSHAPRQPQPVYGRGELMAGFSFPALGFV